jgi:type II secretory pathway pseudopilin PulG
LQDLQTLSTVLKETDRILTKVRWTGVCTNQDVERGFSLVEILIATTVMTMATVALVGVSLHAVRNNQDARSITAATVLASQKMEQLRTLAWAFDAAGAPVSDISTDTTVVPEQAFGGTGLSPSSHGALSENRAGYCDFIDVNGRALGGGTHPPAGTAFVRRWSIDRLALATTEAVLIQVSVMPIGIPGALNPRRGRLRGETRIVSIKYRKGR